jgi:YspA, cpYpsA-related SLOG family
MIVLVCGGRDYSDRLYLFHTMDNLEREAGKPFRGLIHGAARGADRLAAEWQAERIKTNAQFWAAGYPADWDTHGKAAGPIRNQSMLDQNPGIELVIAFPGGRGTADMVARARKKGIPVVEVAPASGIQILKESAKHP